MHVVKRRQSGVAMLLALLTMVVVAGIGTLLFARTINEMKHSKDDAAIVQTLLLARGGANLGGSLLTGSIRDALDAIVNVRSSTTSCWSFGDGACGNPAPTPNSVLAKLTGANSVATELQVDIDALLCDDTLDEMQPNATVSVRVYVTSTACGQPLPSGVSLPQGRFVSGDPRPNDQEYALPFVMVSEASLNEYRRNVVLQGEYRFTVGRVTFAQYALFTNVHRSSEGGSAVWFTDNTLFDGPVHTNEYFRFYANPWFGHKVTTAGCPRWERGTRMVDGVEQEICLRHAYGAIFHDQQNTVRTNLGPNPSFGDDPRNEPELTAGVDWQSEYIPLPSNAYEQETEALNAGIHFGEDVDLSRLRFWAADEDGNPLERDGGDWSPRATYQYIQGTVCEDVDNGYCDDDGATFTYRVRESGLLEVLDEDGEWITAKNASGNDILDFNGVIFVDGRVLRFGGPARGDAEDPDTAPPAIAHFAQMTLATNRMVRITNDITYEDPPCDSAPKREANGTVTPANCGDLDVLNVFGLYTQSADVFIGNQNGRSSYNAPDDVHISGVYMSSEGRVTVEDYDEGPPRGAVHLLGGIIENYYGPFGQFNPNSGAQVHGYNRKFTYDPRMYSSVSPPYFPTIGLDRVKDVRAFSFGQREQVY